MQDIRKVLCPVDFSEYSTLALRYASALARENNAELLVAHLIPDLAQTISYLEGNYIGTVNEALASNARTKMAQFVLQIVPADQPVTVKVHNGNPSEGILQLASDHQADLIVMGTHGHTGYERFFVGSVTNRILHKTTIPVLTVCKPSRHFVHEGQPVIIQNILCALDFDYNNQRIVEMALSLARKYRSRIEFLHVVQKPNGDAWEAVEKRAYNCMRSLVGDDQIADVEMRFLVVAGEPGSVILKTVEEREIDLLVMGHHTRKPLEELFLGSIAKRMVTDAQCPVLVARSVADKISTDS